MKAMNYAEMNRTEDRDPHATLRCRLLLAFAEGAAAGLLLGLALLLVDFIFMSGTVQDTVRTLLISMGACGTCSYLITMIQQLLMQ